MSKCNKNTSKVVFLICSLRNTSVDCIFIFISWVFVYSGIVLLSFDIYSQGYQAVLDYLEIIALPFMLWGISETKVISLDIVKEVVLIAVYALLSVASGVLLLFSNILRSSLAQLLITKIRNEEA